MIKKNELITYIKTNFNIDTTSYYLICEIISKFSDIENGLNIIIEILNNSGIDLTLEELKENKIIESECEE